MEQNTAPRILCIYGSPRKDGNSDQLMNAFVAGLEEGGGVAQKIYLRELRFNPCREIYACRNSGDCALKDDVTAIYAELRSADAIAFAMPVMFYGAGALAKSFIDRAQALWGIKYLLNQQVATGRLVKRKGVLLSVAGSKGQKVFDGLRLIFRYFLDALDADPWGEVVCREVDVKGDIEKRPETLAEARELGKRLAVELRAEIAGLSA
jgi:multimeric flavodoxin WrbA